MDGGHLPGPRYGDLRGIGQASHPDADVDLRDARRPDHRELPHADGERPAAVSAAPPAGALPAAYAMQSGYDALALKQVDLDIETYDLKKELHIDGVTASRREAHPGDT